ncbi:hypothetical protein JCM21900_003557 [Sporobolomyces salmonicolor]
MGKPDHIGPPWSDKVKNIQAGTRKGRRGPKKVQKLKEIVPELEKQSEEMAGRTEEVNGGHGEDGTSETRVGKNNILKKDVAALHKKLDDLQADHAAFLQPRLKLSADLQQTRYQLALDPHHLDRDKQLKQARDIIDSLEVQLKVLTEGRMILLERLEQLEEGWASRAEVERERERDEAAEGRKKLLAEVERANAQLADNLAETQDQLHRCQQVNGDLKDNNARLRVERQTADDAAASAQRQLEEVVEQMRPRWQLLNFSPVRCLSRLGLALLVELSIELLLRFR